ncbi:unnamed protein product [Arabis nemorensis]|uniref:Proline dehydrogenase n=1 Tax=Arabis nemorensis TaxID=586526 RepID=A0A565B0D1_9BRAS|nr:unnamed protein product [Arabis nemorensis]
MQSIFGEEPSTDGFTLPTKTDFSELKSLESTKLENPELRSHVEYSQAKEIPAKVACDISNKLTHVGISGEAQMVDVSSKDNTKRTALACCIVVLGKRDVVSVLLEASHGRIQDICQKCQESNVPLLIDAEDTILQPAIDYMAYSSAILFNADKDRPIVYNTIQAYLRDAGERLHLAVSEAEKENVPMGFKLVRGAYMSSEARLADSLGCKSPIHDTIQNTHACYNNCMTFLMEKASNGLGFGVVLATHNADSGQPLNLIVKESE